MKYNSIIIQYLPIIYNVLYYWFIETRIIITDSFQISNNLPKKVYRHKELILDITQPPEIRLIYEKPNSLSPFKSILQVKNDIKTLDVKLAGVLKIKQIENVENLVTVGIDYGKNKIGVYTPNNSQTLNNDSNFFENLKTLLPKEHYQIVVGLPYREYYQNIDISNDKNHLYYLPQILTCIDFASTLVSHLYNYYFNNDNIQIIDKVIYNCKCQLCLIKGRHKSNAHPSDIICPESYEIIETSQLLIPPVFLSSESYTSTNSDIFSGNISHIKRFNNMDIHTRSAYLITLGFEQNPQSSFYSIPSGNSLPLEADHRRLYLKALTRLAKRCT